MELNKLFKQRKASRYFTKKCHQPNTIICCSPTQLYLHTISIVIKRDTCICSVRNSLKTLLNLINLRLSTKYDEKTKKKMPN